MNIENIVAILGLLGIGGLISGYFTLLWQRRSTALTKMQEYKEVRYKCIVLLMRARLDFGRWGQRLQEYGYTIQTIDDLEALLHDELASALLYASDEFITYFTFFINSPTESNLAHTVLSMRKDLWGVRTKFTASDIKFLVQESHNVTGKNEP